MPGLAGRVIWYAGTSVDQGKVISTNPPAGTQVDKGSTVTIVV